MNISHVRMPPLYLERARSSTAEQWPFKPLVQGSNPCALTKNPCFQGFFIQRWTNQISRYTKSMPITIARFVKAEQCGWAKYALFGRNGRRNKELIGWSSSLKAVGYIKRVSCNGSAWWHGFHSGKNTARAERPELSTSMLSRMVQQSKPTAFWVQKAVGSIKRAERIERWVGIYTIGALAQKLS